MIPQCWRRDQWFRVALLSLGGFLLALLASQGVLPSPTQDVRAFLTAEAAKYGRTVRALGILMGQP